MIMKTMLLLMIMMMSTIINAAPSFQQTKNNNMRTNYNPFLNIRHCISVINTINLLLLLLLLLLFGPDKAKFIRIRCPALNEAIIYTWMEIVRLNYNFVASEQRH